MDGKTKKILNYLKKIGGEVEALDISFGLNGMDENFVQNALDSLVQENLVVAARNDQGKVFYNVATGENAAGKKSDPESVETPKKAKGKAVAGPEDHFDEFVLENEAVNIVTDTIATHIDDLAHAAASAPAFVPPPAPPSAPTPVAPAPSTAVFEVDDDFSPKPKKEKIPAPMPDTKIDDDDFSPKPKKEKKSAPPPDTGVDDDDFSPKPKKKIKEKAAALDGDVPHDGDTGHAAKPSISLPAAVAAGIVILIAAVLISGAMSGGKIASAIKAAENDYIKTLDFDTYKTETTAKIDSLTTKNREFEAKIKYLEGMVKAQDKPAAAPKGKRKR